jgi:general secretion pathway protein G
MVVLVIIALLAGVVTINVRGYLTAGYQNTSKMEIRAIMDGLETFHAVMGRYPTNEEGLAALAQKTEKMPEPLLSRVPVDPWGRAYEYVQPGKDHPYEITCYGADGRPGGDGLDADIRGWELRAEKK